MVAGPKAWSPQGGLGFRVYGFRGFRVSWFRDLCKNLVARYGLRT